MSRIPQSSRGTPRNPQASSADSSASSRLRVRTTSAVARATTPPASVDNIRIRTKSTTARAATPSRSPQKLHVDKDPSPEKQSQLSIKEAIALKRAEAKKKQASAGASSLDNLGSLEDAIPDAPPPEDEDILGRPPLRETIERAKSTGSINLSTRSLPCLPSALFDIHLGISPVPLKSVPSEPPLPPALETGPLRKRPGPAWYETQDLEILKAWGNNIVEIQAEISLFGSLKSIDLHKNQIVSLPDQFADLAALTTLDLSHNALTSLPTNLFSLPALSNLNISNNALTGLPFTAPFSSASSRKTLTTARSLFAPEITRASTPLPKLAIFDASNNKLSAAAIDLDVPKSIITLDLSGNPLGSKSSRACSKLFAALATLQKLKTLRCEKTDVSDDIFEDISGSSGVFPSISVFDFGYTQITENGVRRGLDGLAQQLTFEVTSEDPPSGTTRVIIGKKVVREAWEFEAERRSKSRAEKTRDAGMEWENAAPLPSAAQQNKSGSQTAAPKPPAVKEAWEIEAEQGLLTEGGKRRARAAATAAAASSGLGLGDPPRQPPSPSKTSVLSAPQYYTARTETLTLPASTAPPKVAGHSRAFSLASTSFEKAPPTQASDVSLPTATMPLSLIAIQPFAQTLKILLLNNRRMDRSFTLPPLSLSAPLLPLLEELSLEGCNLGDSISVSTAAAEEMTPIVPSQTQALLPLLTELFPSLRNLNLAFNTLTSAALTAPVLSGLILSSDAAPARKGLKQLHLRGNRITELGGLQGIAALFKGNRDVPNWRLEEMDLRDNEIGKLPPELGLLPLDVLLVDGNTFRVPARRVWEREGTKGLLSWLRGRIE
ncbi:hypothetical protein GGX14DRAFT_630129, partial [Mycena pura]